MKCNIRHYADNPKISAIYVVREMLGFEVSLAQEVDGREQLRYLPTSP